MNQTQSYFPKVSVIVPVWNPGLGISRCIESLRGQTLEDIEMIFVDDCGTDNAMEKVRSAAAEDPRIRIITNAENLGPGPSRNAGIEVARGAYLAFVDSDDYVDAAFLERLYAKAIADQLDIVKGKICYTKEDGTKVDQEELNDRIRKGIQLGKPLFCLFHYQHKSALYRRAFVIDNAVHFGTSRRAEDVTFLLKACHRVERFGIEDAAEYHFCERSDSLVHDMEPCVTERYLAFQEQMDYIVDNMADEGYAYQYVGARLRYNLRLCNYLGKSQEYGEATNRFLTGLRDQVLRFPQLEKLKKESFINRAFCDYGVTLVKEPFKLGWENHKIESYVETIQEWVDFVKRHPECANAAKKNLLRLYSEAEALFQIECSSQDEVQFRMIRRKLLMPARSLPHCLRESIFELMKYSPSVSVIIPMWNPGPGISRCIESLRGQTLEDIEMIFVDDCGTDGAMDAVRLAAAEDPRIYIITNAENMGAGASRNAAIEQAQGEYLAFVDADDYVSSGFLEILYAKGHASNLDIVKGDILYECEDGKITPKADILNKRIQGQIDKGRPLFRFFKYEFQSAIYHGRLFANTNIRFGLSFVGEDSVFLLKVCHVAGSFEIDERATYHYVGRKSSATYTITAKSLDDRISTMRTLFDYADRFMPHGYHMNCYLMDKLKYYVAFYQYVFPKAGMEEALLRFKSEMRSLAMGHTGMMKAKDKHLTLLALIDYDECVAEWPYSLLWDVVQPEVYMDVITRQTDFLISHKQYCVFFDSIKKRSKSFMERMGQDGISPAGIEAYIRQVKALWRRPVVIWMRINHAVSRRREKLPSNELPHSQVQVGSRGAEVHC